MTGIQDAPAHGDLGGEPHDAVDLARVDAALFDHVRSRAQMLTSIDVEVGALTDSLSTALGRGKRLRAAFCLWGAHSVAGERVPAAEMVAAAIELFHLAALIHDDVMDHSDARRGLPTVHRRFATEHRRAGRIGDADEFGVAVAILVGDLCLTWSDDVFAHGVADLDTASARAARDIWSTMRDEAIAGQYLDMISQTRTSTCTGRVQRVLRYKSAKYTVAQPLRLGARVAGADGDLLERYERIGLDAGEAFQLRDDVLGIFGDPARTGKPIVDDIREGKRTMLIALAESHATPPQRAVLATELGNPDITDDGLADVCDVLRSTGAVDRVEQRIDLLVERAVGDIARLPVDPVARAALTELVDRCVRREV